MKTLWVTLLLLTLSIWGKQTDSNMLIEIPNRPPNWSQKTQKEAKVLIKFIQVYQKKEIEASLNLLDQLIEIQNDFCTVHKWEELKQILEKGEMPPDSWPSEITPSSPKLEIIWNKTSPQLVYNDPQTKHWIEIYSHLAHKMEQETKIKMELDRPYRPQIPLIQISHLIYGNPPQPRLAMVYPQKGDPHPPTEYKIVYFYNIIIQYIQCIVIPVAQQILPPQWSMLINPDSYLSNRVMHTICHHQDPALIEDEEEIFQTTEIVLKEFFPVYSEIRSELLAIYNTTTLVESGILPEELEKSIYATYIATMLTNLTGDPSERDYQASLIQFNHFVKKNGIRILPSKKRVALNFFKLKKAVSDLMKEVRSAGSSYTKAESFISSSQGPTLETKPIMEILKSLKINPQYILKK